MCSEPVAMCPEVVAMCPELVEGHASTSSARILRENRGNAIWEVGGETGYSKIKAESDVLRLVHGPDVYVVILTAGPSDELRILLDQRQIRPDDTYPVRQPAIPPPSKIIFDEQGAFQARQQPAKPLDRLH